ncbi:hypothetical protein N7468_006122 [Penicillium chermesinum]|uniref:Uncharacterized protein n=1 Tax=Penicillium chermesinum TaxID=63820 RepID=A0A9W9TNL6_9EURO|nr:uncharacterized protein N7468_006122 [Penicillium chermesinum]KAJ5233166.1 hypothetical protein N7468_006122 [Penicillium chermesinum]
MPWKPPVIGSRPVAILGAGVLGRRIACSWVTGGYNVAIRDPSAEQRQAAMHYIDNNLTKFSKIFGNTAKKPGEYAAFEDLDSAVKNAWFALEAVPEKLDLKISTFGELATKAPDDCILGSNSSSYKSSLMLDHVGKEARKRVLNVHYMMPPTNKIVEIMTSTYTHDEIFPFLARKHKDIGLLPAVARKESTGFIINRLWAAVKRETLSILAEGVSDPQEIDRLWLEFFGHGKATPCAMMDEVGLDTVAFIEDHYVQERHLDGTNTVQFLRENYINQGRLGHKSGNGGLYPADHAAKSEDQKDFDGNSTAPKLYVLDVGLGENITHDFQHAGRIILSSADGKNAKPIVTGLEAPDGIDISVPDNRIFWTNMGIPSENDGSIQSARLDGSDVQTVIAKGSVHTPKQICLDQANKKIYFCDREGMRVHRANFDGSEQEVLIQRGDFRNKSDMEDQTKWCVGITVDPKNGKFYWTQKGFSKSGKGRIFRANIAMPSGATPSTRSDIETVFENLPEPIDLEIDTETEMLYWTDRGEYPLGNSLNRGYVGDKQKEKTHELLSRHLHEAIGLKLDKVNKHIYFTDLGGTVYRTDADGKKKTAIYTGDNSFTGICLVHE